MLSLPGDVYVTRHSNLSEVHVIFHLVTDTSLSVSDIPARHPVMVGLRNCLHAASHHDIHTITIPLLMVHDMSPVSQTVTCFLVQHNTKPYKCHTNMVLQNGKPQE